jgi:hypothetical protein
LRGHSGNSNELPFTMRNMQRRMTVMAPLLAVLSLCSCHHGNVILILDEQWSVKQAEADCRSRSREGVPPCAVDPFIEIRNSEVQISRAFKVDPECKGITLVTLNISDSPRRLNSMRTWWLFLELSRGGDPDERRFTVSQTEDPHRPYSTTGQGQPDFIAETSCKFVRGKIGRP